MRIGRLSLILGLVAVLMVLVGPLAAERGDDSERKSKNGKATGSIDGIDVTVEFGRPNVKGRELWGALVPYGEVWRTGADEATTVTFSGDVTVEGQPLAAGTYSLFTIPGEDGWQVIFNKVAKQWGAYKYDASNDALRVEAQPTAAERMESLNFEIAGSDIVMRWGELAVPVSISSAD